jgi:hypothetical protein
MENEDLDPRIQIELENLNNSTDEINKLEIELEEANSTFRILLNDSTRRLKEKAKKYGSAIDKSRPFYEALEKAKIAQIECQKAAVKYQRANEIHSVTKETIKLAEQRFMSNSHEWKFDLAWQEMINHHIEKVMEAEKQKADSIADHQLKTSLFHAAEARVQAIEQKFRSAIQKSRPYFEEKQICQDQLQTQKERIEQIQGMLQKAKSNYAIALKNLEMISESIHKMRGDLGSSPPPGMREPGVGAESEESSSGPYQRPIHEVSSTGSMKMPSSIASSTTNILNNFNQELDNCELRSLDSHSLAVSEKEDEDAKETEESENFDDEENVEALRLKVKSLAVRPIEGGDGEQQKQIWENELNATVDKLDHLMMMHEYSRKQDPYLSLPDTPAKRSTETSQTLPRNKTLKRLNEQLPLANVASQFLPVSTSQIPIRTNLSCDNLVINTERKLSLQ